MANRCPHGGGNDEPLRVEFPSMKRRRKAVRTSHRRHVQLAHCQQIAEPDRHALQQRNFDPELPALNWPKKPYELHRRHSAHDAECETRARKLEEARRSPLCLAGNAAGECRLGRNNDCTVRAVSPGGRHRSSRPARLHSGRYCPPTRSGSCSGGPACPSATQARPGKWWPVAQYSH